jgi:hypothetical protein
MTDTKPTPRTDAAVVHREYILREMDIYSHKFVLADFARTLERELAAIKSQPVPVAWMADDGRVVNAATKETSMPRASKVSFTIPLYTHSASSQETVYARNREIHKILERAEKAEAELAALRLELARLDGEIPYGN